MQCPHCGIDFQPSYISFGRVGSQARAIGGNLETIALPDFVERPGEYPGDYPEDAKRVAWAYTSTACTKCRQPILELVKRVWGPLPPPKAGEWREANEKEGFVEQWRQRVYPKNTNRTPVPQEVTAHIAGDYNEACLVLADSPKASAALSRRCLQNMLSDHGYTKRNLVDQIDDVLNEQDRTKMMPGHLHGSVDAIRQFGNFGAHPMTDQTTLQIIDVEPGEAEWCLEIIEQLFDFYYVAPERLKARRGALNAKLTQAGKNPVK